MKKTILFMIILAASATLVWNLYSTSTAFPDIDISTKEVSPFTYCSMKYQGSYSQFEPAIRSLMQNLQRQSVQPAGPLLGIFFNSPEDTKPQNLEWEVGFPITPQSRVQAPLRKKQWTHTFVVTAVHVGSYETTQETYIQMFEWMETHNLIQKGPILEKYISMPSRGRGAGKARTEIWIPCQKPQPPSSTEINLPE
ncbi:GyrI-like domain-containing protein [bacterium]|nr:GyrI-like domain-containing protein [bacterium]